MKKAGNPPAVRPLAPAIGAEVAGVDLSACDDATWRSLHELFLKHKVLFFRDQDLTPTDLVAVAGRFGPVGRYPFAEPLVGRRDHVRIPVAADLGDGGPDPFGQLLLYRDHA